MSKTLDPLSDLARQAVEVERNRPDAPVEARDRVLIRVTATAAVAAAVGGAGAAAVAALVGAKSGSKVAAFKAAAWSARGIVLVAGAFVTGGAVGAATHVAGRSVQPMAALTAGALLQTPTSTGERQTAPVAPLSPDADLGPPVSVAFASPPRAQPAVAGRGPDTSLAAERTLIDRARMALARGEPLAALDALNAHVKDHAGGRLAQEREALAVQALALAGRSGDARARADRFRSAYPNSVFLGAVEGVVLPKASAAPE